MRLAGHGLETRGVRPYSTGRPTGSQKPDGVIVKILLHIKKKIFSRLLTNNNNNNNTLLCLYVFITVNGI
jgi:hypothetical protein